jgi:small subunit ribosomal protein S6
LKKAYEIVFILRPDLEDTQVQTSIERIGARITERGGSINSVEPWGRRKLAYSIQKFREGAYVLIRFELDSLKVQDLRNSVALVEEVIRFAVTGAVPIRPRPKAPETPPSEPAETAPAAVPSEAVGGG